MKLPQNFKYTLLQMLTTVHILIINHCQTEQISYGLLIFLNLQFKNTNLLCDMHIVQNTNDKYYKCTLIVKKNQCQMLFSKVTYNQGC